MAVGFGEKAEGQLLSLLNKRVRAVPLPGATTAKDDEAEPEEQVTSQRTKCPSKIKLFQSRKEQQIQQLLRNRPARQEYLSAVDGLLRRQAEKEKELRKIVLRRFSRSGTAEGGKRNGPRPDLLFEATWEEGTELCTIKVNDGPARASSPGVQCRPKHLEFGARQIIRDR